MSFQFAGGVLYGREKRVLETSTGLCPSYEQFCWRQSEVWYRRSYRFVLFLCLWFAPFLAFFTGFLTGFMEVFMVTLWRPLFVSFRLALQPEVEYRSRFGNLQDDEHGRESQHIV